MSVDVAFCRTLKPGSKGGDVVAHKRAISRALPKAYQWTQFTDYYGPAFQTAVKAYQRSRSIPQTGVIGTTTHNSLEKAHKKGSTEWAFDSLAIKFAKDFCTEFTTTPEMRVRQAMVAAGFFWYQHRATIAYSQYRPMQLGKPPWVPSRMDCSGFYTACSYAGGAKDPNGRNFDHQGYTGTLMGRGVRVASVDSLEIGDAIFYGYTTNPSPAFPYGSPTHVAMYVGKINGEHSVLSMGHYPMGLYRYNYRTVNNYHHYTVL
jgi:cell wall-associated NlpC family hydrolase